LGNTTLKSELLALLQLAHDEEQDVIGGLSEADRNEAGTPQHWSIKDNIAHLVFWRQHTIDRLAGVLRDEGPFNAEEIERRNQQRFEEQQYRPWTEVLLDDESSHLKLIEQVQKLTDDDLMSTSRFTWQRDRLLLSSILINGYWHVQEHLVQFYLDHGEREHARHSVEKLANALNDALKQRDGTSAARGDSLYNLACFYAKTNQLDEALPVLKESLQLNPDLVEWSHQDPDLVLLREKHGPELP
jgi:tetratricopeptide (TPR) repeat protein